MEDFVYYEFENFRLDVANEQLLKDNQPIPLTHKAYKTLLILVQNYGQLVKKEDIINDIWCDSFVEDSNLTQHIYVLRKTLGNNKLGKPFIETIPKRGYTFIGEIKKVSPSSIKRSAYLSPHETDDGVLSEQFIYLKDDEKFLHSTNGFHTSADASKHVSYQAHPPNGKKTDRIKKYAALVAGIILLSLAAFSWRSLQPATPTEIRSIAVLPFKPIGEESDNAKMGFGIADAVITSLSKLPDVPVRPTSAVFQFADKTFDPVSAGQELGVDSVLEGTVQRDGEWVRVSVRLIKITDGSTIWADTFDERFTNIFALQDSISTKVAKSLVTNLSKSQEQQLVTRETSSPEANQAYQLGVYFWNKRTKEDLEKAVNYFRQAIDFDNNYALAYAMLADSYNMLVYYKFTDDSAGFINEADEAAKKALSLNNSLGEGYIALSYVQIAKYKDYEAATKSIERAVQLSPNNPTARIRYGWQLLRQKNVEGTYEQMRVAQENDPLSPVSNSALCSVLIIKRNYPEALRYCEKTVELQATAPFVKIQLSSAYFLNGKNDEAISILKSELNSERYKDDAKAALAYIYAKLGKTKEAEEIYVQLKKDKQISKKYGDLALVAFTLGKKTEALEFFKEMVGPSKMLSPTLRYDPFWEDIFKDEDFLKVIGKQ